MTFVHAVAWIDHHHALVMPFDGEQVQHRSVHAHAHPTHQHHSSVRTEHEFFGEVCDAIQDIPQVLVTGSKTSLADFMHYVEKHRAAVGARIVGRLDMEKPTDPQLVAHARKFFRDRETLASVPGSR